jgi:HK97 gp10 family phage protein
MAEFITVQVTGLKQLEENLKQLQENIAKNALRAVARKAMQIMRDKIAGDAPRRTGALAAGILMTASIRGEGVSGGNVLVRVGLRTSSKATRRKGERSPDDVYYGRFLEFGTRKMAARPFMRPAFDSTREQVLKEFGELLGAEIEKRAKKANITLQ